MKRAVKLGAFQQRIYALLSVCLGLYLPSLSHAADSKRHADKTQVIVLGIQALNGDDALAAELTRAFRQVVAATPGWHQLKGEVSLTQMTLMHGCGDTLTVECMSAMAKTLHAERMIYGTLKRVRKGRLPHYAFEISYFDAEMKRIAYSTQAELDRSVRRQNVQLEFASSLVQAMPRDAHRADFTLEAGQAGLTVKVNGELAGLTDRHGRFSSSRLKAGVHRVAVLKGGEELASTEVKLEPGATARVQLHAGTSAAALAEAERRERVSIWKKSAGWTAIGLGGVFLGLTAYTWVQLNQIDDDPILNEYRQRVPSNVTDVCDNPQPYAAPGDPEYDEFDEVQRLCRKANRLQNVWQWVFLTMGVASTGAGTYLVASDALANDDPVPRKDARLQLMPSLNFWGGGIDARVYY